MIDQPAVRPWEMGRPDPRGPGPGPPGQEAPRPTQAAGPSPPDSRGPGPEPPGQEAPRPTQAAGPSPPDLREYPLAGPRGAQPSLEARPQRPAAVRASMGPGASPRPGLRGERSPPDHRRSSAVCRRSRYRGPSTRRPASGSDLRGRRDSSSFDDDAMEYRLD